MTRPERSYRGRIQDRTRHIRRLLDQIDELAARADASTLAPRHAPTEATSRSGYADPTLITVAERDDLLGRVELRLWDQLEDTHKTARLLSTFRLPIQVETRCACPPQCCPDGCTRPRPEGRIEHDTCRKRRSRAARRGEAWALEDVTTVTTPNRRD